MMKWSWLCCLPVFFSFFFSEACGQTTYFMGNQTIRECEGILRDSEENEDFSGYYDHNEDYVTTICIENAEEITLTFTEFHIEEDFDFLYIYEGADLTGNLLATYTGFGIPPSITVSGSDCISIHFTSDDNIAQFGWVLRWEVETEEPEPIDIAPVVDYSCEDPAIFLELTAPVLCDSLNPSNLFLVGPGNADVQSVRPINCVDGVTDQFEITFTPVISISGNYQIRLIAFYRDACDEVHEMISSYDFTVDDCPLNIDFVADTICPGECVEISAEVTGGDGIYSYDWSPASTDATVLVCPEPGDLVCLRVTDGLGASVTDCYEPLFFPRPEILNIPSDTICRLHSQFNLEANPPGGSWSATGVHENNIDNGLYQAWRNRGNPVSVDNIVYTDTNGCTIDTQMTVLFISVGNNDGECLNAPPFQVSGGVPAGGVWSGNGIDANGVFTPEQPGRFYVQYEAPNGCVWGKNVFINDEIEFSGPDTVCNTEDAFRINISPSGGIWDDNPAIWRHGNRVDINRSQLGDNELIYRTEGGACVDTFRYFVKAISLDNNEQVFCPEILGNTLAIPFVPSIPDGQWLGVNVLDGDSGLLDVSNAEDGDEFELRYEADGCFVDATIRMVTPALELIADNTFCRTDSLIAVDDLINYTPDDADITGVAITEDSSGIRYWNPSVGSLDSGAIFIEAHGCIDSAIVYYHQSPVIIQDRICRLDPPQDLGIEPSFKSANGPGIVFFDAPLFDASDLDTGWISITIESAEGCRNTDSIYISGRIEPTIGNFEEYFCSRDTVISPAVNPAGGQLWLNDQPISGFNPSALGEGGHVLRYDFGEGNCAASTSTSFLVLPPLDLKVTASVDTLCPGELVRLSAEPSGGDPSANFDITWSGQLGFGQVHYDSPSSTQLYVAQADDGCSDPARDSIIVHVFPDFNVRLNYGPRVCADEEGRVEIELEPPGNYELFRNNVAIPSDYVALPENFELLVKQSGTACVKRVPVEMPAFSAVSANFSLFPAGCINTYENEIYVDDLSAGAVRGFWALNGMQMDYFAGENERLIFDSSGIYQLKLVVENEGGCTDSLQKEICVEPFTSVQVPNAFSPNGDNINDEFRFHTIGIKDIHWMIYDRYGSLVFESFEANDSWDGTIDGQPGLAQAYMLVLSYTDLSGHSKTEHRTIQLVR